MNTSPADNHYTSVRKLCPGYIANIRILCEDGDFTRCSCIRFSLNGQRRQETHPHVYSITLCRFGNHRTSDRMICSCWLFSQLSRAPIIACSLHWCQSRITLKATSHHLTGTASRNMLTAPHTVSRKFEPSSIKIWHCQKSSLPICKRYGLGCLR